MAKQRKTPAKLTGNMALHSDKRGSFSAAQVALLEAIAACGSISAAAKQVGISYKTAWDRVDAINNLCDRPVVVRAAGGTKGGGTTLTDYGKRLLDGFSALAQEHQKFIDRVGNRLQSFNDVANFMRTGLVNSSARNQFRCTVKNVRRGVVNAEVELRVSDAQTLIAQITLESAARLGLKRGTQVVALIKSSWIILSRDVDIVTSARNKLVGTIDRIVKGAVNSEVTVNLADGKSICALITNTSVKELKLKRGDSVCALFKASSIILIAD